MIQVQCWDIFFFWCAHKMGHLGGTPRWQWQVFGFTVHHWPYPQRVHGNILSHWRTLFNPVHQVADARIETLELGGQCTITNNIFFANFWNLWCFYCSRCLCCSGRSSFRFATSIFWEGCSVPTAQCHHLRSTNTSSFRHVQVLDTHLTSTRVQHVSDTPY